jgi:hypothetical protein
VIVNCPTCTIKDLSINLIANIPESAQFKVKNRPEIIDGWQLSMIELVYELSIKRIRYPCYLDFISTPMR